MTKETYLKLYEKFLNQACTAEELELLNWYKDEFELLEDEVTDTNLRQKIYEKLLQSITRQEQVPDRQNKLKFLYNRKVITVAATIAVIILSTVLLMNKESRNKIEIQSKQLVVKPHDIKPGGNKAILILADGSSIELNIATEGKIASQNGADIIKSQDGGLVYKAFDSESSNQDAVINIISIPKGGQYNLTLPDGTKVWLNSASSLKFPTKFNGRNRMVELDGEAYFEVSKNKHLPFSVKVKNMQVEVLGTHFNIMAYADEKYVNTTLLEGRVRLKSESAEAILTPGQQGSFAQNGFKIHAADTEQAMAWKNGYFIFNDEELSSIMRKISRWYDVDIEYKSKNNLSYTGTVSRFKNVSDVLKMLTLTGTVHFNIEERRITVIN